MRAKITWFLVPVFSLPVLSPSLEFTCVYHFFGKWTYTAGQEWPLCDLSFSYVAGTESFLSPITMGVSELSLSGHTWPLILSKFTGPQKNWFVWGEEPKTENLSLIVVSKCRFCTEIQILHFKKSTEIVFKKRIAAGFEQGTRNRKVLSENIIWPCAHSSFWGWAGHIIIPLQFRSLS